MEELEHKCWVFVPIGKTQRNAYHQCGNAQQPNKLTCRAHYALEEHAQALKREVESKWRETRRIA